MLRSPSEGVCHVRLGVWVSAVVALVAMLMSAVFVTVGSASRAAGVIAFSSGRGVYVLQSDGGSIRPLWRSARFVSDVAWSPDGRRLAVSTSATASDPKAGGIWVMSAAGRRAVRVSSIAAQSVTWSPDGQRIAFTWKNGVWVMKASGSNARLLRRTPTGLPKRNVDWASTGRIAFDVGGYVPRIYVMKADGTGLQEALPSTASHGWSDELMEPDWSPDGRRIAFTYCLNTSGVDECQIAVMNANGWDSTPLTIRSSVYQGAASWSPDGRRIAFVRGGAFCCGAVGTIYVMNANGSGKMPLAAGSKGAHLAWQPSPATWAQGAKAHTLQAAPGRLRPFGR